jgi:hypothetical protein
MPIAKQENPADLSEMVEQIQSQPDFVAFSQALLKDLKEKPEAWENRDLPSFLEALGAWVDDMNGYYQAKGGRHSAATELQNAWGSPACGQGVRVAPARWKIKTPAFR